MSQPAPPRLLPMLAGGNGVPRNPAGHQFEPKLDGSPHSSDLCQAGGSSGMGPDWEHSLGPAVPALLPALAWHPWSVADGALAAEDFHSFPGHSSAAASASLASHLGRGVVGPAPLWRGCRMWALQRSHTNRKRTSCSVHRSCISFGHA